MVCSLNSTLSLQLYKCNSKGQARFVDKEVPGYCTCIVSVLSANRLESNARLIQLCESPQEGLERVISVY